MIPIRIQRSRKHKQISPNGLRIKYCGRPGIYGNPFKVGDYVDSDWFNEFTPCDKFEFFTRAKILDAENCVYLFYKYQLQKIDVSKLTGFNLSCWCKITEPCHVNILLKIANK